MKYVKKLTVKNKVVLDKVICNMCGDVIIDSNASIADKKDFLSIRKSWGYHSTKDGERHRIDLCQSCYDTFVMNLKIPPTIKNPR